MSRIIVKGLPSFFTEDKLKEHFSKRLVDKNQSTTTNDLITDIKLLKDRQGNSRRFAFIGFKNESDAFDAVDYFNGSYINTAKIEVSMAKSFADPRVPKSMKEKKREAYKRMREREEMLLTQEEEKNKKAKVDKKHNIDAEINKNKQLQEFIETMKPSSQVASWEKTNASNIENTNTRSIDVVNDDDEHGGNALLAQALAMQDDDEGDNIIAEKESDDEYEDFNKNDEENEDEERNEPTFSLDQFGNKEDGGSNDDKNENGEDNLAQDDKVSDLDWFKQRRVRIREGENVPVEEQEASKDQDESKEKIVVEEALKKPKLPKKSDEEIALEKISKTGRLFLRNILYTSTEKDFEQLFEPFGALEEVHVALDTRTGQSKGFAYIHFKDPKDAVQAYIELDKQIFQGRLLHILPADAKKTHRLDEFDLKNLPLKKQRELKKKASATKQSFAWNSLYMNQDAVLGSVAAKLGLQKSELIDPENSSSAVKQALAEAHVIGDVRKYFEDKGVDLAKFQSLKSPEQRDDRVILVKNFPYGTTTEELGELFLPFGKLERMLMPQAGTIAIIQYRDVTAARAAFTKLSYKRFKDGIIYLEKGPKDCFTRDAKDDENVERDEPAPIEAKPSSHDIMNTKNDEKEKTNDIHDDHDDELDGPTVSIFIKNLNFSTTTAELNDRFKKFNGFVVAQVKTKPDSKNQGKTLSMGFGFAEFKTKEQANAVISAMNGEIIDGHKIELKLSHRQSNTTNNNGKNKSKKSMKNGKIIVKNLPFEATRKDVFELFNSFGQLKSVRVPKKFDKSARGFAFVEFLLPKEAENAMDQLQGVHLLGRRLVMQPAEQEAADAEEEIARMTKKMKKQVTTSKIAQLRSSGGRKKLEMDEEDPFDM